jgi:hypothetical protein
VIAAEQLTAADASGAFTQGRHLHRCKHTFAPQSLIRYHGWVPGRAQQMPVLRSALVGAAEFERYAV